MKYVLDASVALAWVVKDEQSRTALDMRAAVGRSSLIVPSPWPLEVANTLAFAVLRGRITDDDMNGCLQDLMGYHIYIAQETYWPPTQAQLDAILTYRLTAYDWTYLRLARQYELPLLTLDQRMIEGARAMGVELVEV